MKNLLIPCLLLCLASCKKERTCNCDITETTNYDKPNMTVKYYPKKIVYNDVSKKQAKNLCAQHTDYVDSTIVAFSCSIK